MPTTADEPVATTTSDDQATIPWHDPQLTPLSAADIQFYLTVMRAAAERVQHPTAADQAAKQHLQGLQTGAPTREADPAAAVAKAQAAGQAAIAAAMRGDQTAVAKLNAQAQAALGTVTSPPGEDKLSANTRAMLLNNQADTLIVRERHLDERRYDRVRDSIEEIIVPPALDVGASCGGDDCGGAPELTQAQNEHARLHQAALTRNSKTLAPYRDAIHAVQAVVRPRFGAAH